MSLYTYWRTRGLLGLSAAAAALVALGIGAMVNIPPVGVRSGALLLTPGAATSVALVSIAALISAALGGLIGGKIRPDAPVFAAGALFAAVSWHSGRMRDVFFELVNPASSIFFKLAAELAVYGLILAIILYATSHLVTRGLLQEDAARDGVDPASATPGESGLALIATAAAYGLLCFLLVPTDDKKQAMFGTMLAAFTAVAAIHSLLVPSAKTWPFVTGVLLGGLATYAIATTNPGILQIGYLATPGARALPLDHAAAAGLAATGAFWYSRRWRRAE